ncbi:MAG: hypothetical protein IT310_05200 [Anaerolineales bacterium]|nr:hypothetical protein [Anaerolineales bacterium]
MNKQELLKQADTNFQRGNRALAKQYLADLLNAYPDEEAAWILLAKIAEDKEHKIECYERAFKINPYNSEVKLALFRLKNQNTVRLAPESKPHPLIKILSGASVALVLLIGLVSASYAVAKNNPASPLAKLIDTTTATPEVGQLSDDVASKTRAEVSQKYPQYALLVDSLLSVAVNNAENGMEGAPERPGSEIIPSDKLGQEARDLVESSLPQPNTLTTVTLTEQQLTSWLALEMKNSPDLPLQDVQVYLRDGTIQIWGMVNGASNSTSALVTGTLSLDSAGKPAMQVVSVQIGQQVIPGILTSQAESWLNQALQEELAKQAPGVTLTDIKVDSGLLIISGMK